MDLNRQIFRSNALIQIAQEAIGFLEATPKYPLPLNDRFNGSGVYALYYNGNHPEYLAIKGGVKPIYVGKAVPTGWRTGSTNRNIQEPKLKQRLGEHVRSIESTDTLRLADFQCRFMIIPNVEAELISVVESRLINIYMPVWNTTIDGFGNHDPGKGRYNQAKSKWDILHPGRDWADKLKG